MRSRVLGDPIREDQVRTGGASGPARLTSPTSAAQTTRAAAGLAALWLWAIQLALNLAWSVVFFGRRSMGGGLAVIVPLWAAIAGSAACAARVAPLASALLLPYLAWTGFAGFLNFRVWQLNRRR